MQSSYIPEQFPGHFHAMPANPDMPTSSEPLVPAMPAPSASGCRICTIRLEQICYQRAWWFRAFREILATGIRLFALAYRVPADHRLVRSPMCCKCLRFRKNALQARSPFFNWLDGYLNPLFNRARDALLTPEELEKARELARCAADPEFGTGLAKTEHPNPQRSRP